MPYYTSHSAVKDQGGGHSASLVDDYHNLLNYPNTSNGIIQVTPLVKADYSNGGFVFGLPPVYPTTPPDFKDVVVNSMMYIKIRPVLMTSDISLDATYLSAKNIRIQTNDDLITTIQKTVGIRPGNDNTFTFATLLRSITESFSNTYEESYYQEIADNWWSKSKRLRSALQYRGGTVSSGKMTDLMRAIPEMEKGLKEMLPVVGKSWGGGRIDLPKVWVGASWGVDDTIDMLFVAPSSDPVDILNWVIRPVYILKLLAAPRLEEDLNYYSFGTFVDIEIPFIVKHQLSGITSLNIQWGGDQALFTTDQLPLVAKASITFQPLKQVQEIEPLNVSLKKAPFMTSVQASLSYMTNGSPNGSRTMPQTLSVPMTRSKKIAEALYGEEATQTSRDLAQRGEPANIPGNTPATSKPAINNDSNAARRRANLNKLKNKSS